MMKARLLLIINTLFTSVLMVSCASNPPTFNKAAIATSHPLATQAGFRALDQGGNAFDAAVAASAVMSVVAPYGAGLGGGSLWLLQSREGTATLVDAREVSPRHIYQNTPQNSRNTSSPLFTDNPISAAIPGQPAALVHISKKYGIRPLAANLADAIHIATQGFRANKQYRYYASARLNTLKQQISSPFLHQGNIPASGSIIKQPELAATLMQLGRKGHNGFYQGEVANNIISDLNKAGGDWTLQDLSDYKVIERPPISFSYKGASITTAPPPSYGGITLQQALKILERFDTSEMSRVEKVDLISRVMRVTSPEIATWLGDPAYSDLPIKQLTSGAYLSYLAEDIAANKPTTMNVQAEAIINESEAFMPQISIMDKWGNKASVSLSMNMPFGSAFTSTSTGILLNNSLASFAPNTASNNIVEPGKRPLSYMTPTLIESSDSLTIMGASSGKHTSTSLLLAILDYLDNTLDNMRQHAPSYHYDTRTDSIKVEPSTFSNNEKKELEAMGHNIQEHPHDHWDLQVIHSDKTTGSIDAFSATTGGGQAIVR